MRKILIVATIFAATLFLSCCDDEKRLYAVIPEGIYESSGGSQEVSTEGSESYSVDSESTESSVFDSGSADSSSSDSSSSDFGGDSGGDCGGDSGGDCGGFD